MEKKKKSRVALRVLCEGALMVALAQILSYLKLWELPQGGSVTIGMFPIFLFCIRWGFGPGMLASVVFSVLQLVLDDAYAYSWQSMLGDYIVAFSVLGVAGLFARMKGGFFLGSIAGCVARFLVHRQAEHRQQGKNHAQGQQPQGDMDFMCFIHPHGNLLFYCRVYLYTKSSEY